jgi:hypothetical protein
MKLNIWNRRSAAITILSSLFLANEMTLYIKLAENFIWNIIWTKSLLDLHQLLKLNTGA